MSANLEHALALLRHGLPIFPVCSPLTQTRCLEHRELHADQRDVGKVPLVKWGDYQDRLPTETEVRDWWTRWSCANIGMATGSASDLVVIDIDGQEATEYARQLGGLPVGGPQVATGRVGGKHYYCGWREDAPTIFAKRSGVDFRGQGGYVLLPPSRHRTGVLYTWLVDLEQCQAVPELPRWIDTLAAQRSDGSRASRGPLVVLGDIPDHERNITLLRLGGVMRRAGFSQTAIEAALLVTNSERCRPPLDDAEVVKVADSVARYTPVPGIAWPTYQVVA